VVIVAVVAGAIVLFPSLALLFRLTLGGQLGHADANAGVQLASGGGSSGSARGGQLAAGLLVAGIGFLTIADAAWAHAIGVACLFVFIIVGFRAALPSD
jgi:cytochrome d ubiquinol oxidase subunit II